VFLSHFGPEQDCALAGISYLFDNLRTPNHLTRVLAHIALAYPEPTLFFFVPTYAAFIHYGTLLFMAFRRNREVELHTKRRPHFLAGTSPHHHLQNFKELLFYTQSF
jgi:hypothetical protein